MPTHAVFFFKVMLHMFSYSISVRERVRLVVRKALIAIPVVLMSTLVAAQAPYVRADKPINDEQGRVSVIIDFADDAHLKYSANMPILPRGKNDKDATPLVYFHNPKTEALVADFERSYGFTRTGMTSWVGNSATASLTPEQINRLRQDVRIKQIFDDSADSLSSWDDSPSPPVSGTETNTWGHQAVNGQVRTVNNNRKIYIIDSGVAAHLDLPSVSSRINVASGAAECNVYDPNTYPVVGCYAHSTHVAGIIGAQANNGIGTIGVYAGANMVSLSVLKRTGSDMCANSNGTVGDDDSVYRSRVGYALDYVFWDTLYNNVPQLVNIVSISINSAGFSIDGSTPQSNWAKVRKIVTPDMVFVGCGIQPECTLEEQYQCNPGAFVAQSAGNNNVDKTCTQQIFPKRHYLPYYITDPEAGAVIADASDGIMVVGAINKLENRPTPTFSPSNPLGLTGTDPGSNYGSCVDIWAPGDQIYSTWGALTGNTLLVRRTPTLLRFPVPPWQRPTSPLRQRTTLIPIRCSILAQLKKRYGK